MTFSLDPTFTGATLTGKVSEVEPATLKEIEKLKNL